MVAGVPKNQVEGGVSLQLPRRIKLLILCQVIASVLLIAFAYRQYRDHVTSGSRNLAQCQRNLRLIYRAVQAYRKDHGGDYPPVLMDLPPGVGSEGLYPHYIRDPQVFVCPAVTSVTVSLDPVRQSYRYDLWTNPGFGQFADPRDPAVQRWKHLRDLSPRRLGKELTVVWCPVHAAPDDEMPGKRLALKADGRLVWEPGFGTEQEKLVAGCRGSYGPPGR